jgi:hypothetical protein
VRRRGEQGGREEARKRRGRIQCEGTSVKGHGKSIAAHGGNLAVLAAASIHVATGAPPGEAAAVEARKRRARDVVITCAIMAPPDRASI